MLHATVINTTVNRVSPLDFGGGNDAAFIPEWPLLSPPLGRPWPWYSFIQTLQIKFKKIKKCACKLIRIQQNVPQQR